MCLRGEGQFILRSPPNTKCATRALSNPIQNVHMQTTLSKVGRISDQYHRAHPVARGISHQALTTGILHKRLPFS